MQVVGCPVAQADLPGAGEPTQGQRACCAAGQSSGRRHLTASAGADALANKCVRVKFQ